MLGIDWFTFIAQIVNFVILIVLLKVFLYKPIINAMDGREAKISSRLEESARKRQEAEEEKQALQQERSDLADQREDLISQAKDDAAGQKKELMDQVRRDVEQQRGRWREDLEQEKSSFLKDLRVQLAGELHATLDRACRDLAGAELEQQILDVFVQRLQALTVEQARQLSESVQHSGKPLVVQSHFEIPAEARHRIEAALSGQLSISAAVEYEISPELICGVELRADGRKITWSFKGYLRNLEEKMEQAFQEQLEADDSALPEDSNQGAAGEH